MTAMAMRSPAEREQMAERLAAGRDEKISDEEKRRMNDGFVQVYSKGWARMRELLRETKSQAPCCSTPSLQSTWMRMVVSWSQIRRRSARPSE